MPCDPSSQARQLHQEGPSRYLGKVVLSRRALARSSYPTMQAPRQASRMRVGRCMQRKSWGGEVERTGNGAV